MAVAPVFGVILSEPAVAEGAMDYLRIIRWSVPFIGLGGSIQGFMNSMRRTRAVMVVTVASNALNIFLNWVLIFGGLGAPCNGSGRGRSGNTHLTGDSGGCSLDDVRYGTISIPIPERKTQTGRVSCETGNSIVSPYCDSEWYGRIYYPEFRYHGGKSQNCISGRYTNRFQLLPEK